MKVPYRKADIARLSLVIALTVSLLIGVYPHVRFGGYMSGGGDAERFTAWITSVQVSGSIVPEGSTYPHGYGYQLLALMLIHLGGVGLGQFQLFFGTVLLVWTVFVAWLFYREITNSNIGAAVATFILLLQPELLFALLRGTHEKFTRGLMFLCLYFLLRSILSRGHLRRFATFLLAFYLCIYALITFNSLLATSFITALTLALVLSIFLDRRKNSTRSDGQSIVLRRLLYATAISLVLAFLFIFYAYTPARQSILAMQSIAERLARLFLEVEETAANPYDVIPGGWISPLVYLVVSIANWLLLIASFVLWAVQTATWWRKRTWPDEPRAILLWSLYGAFGMLGALTILVDVSGAIAGNLQHRIFPTFAMIAAALVADWFVRQQRKRRAASRLAYGVLASGIAFLGVVAVVKATNEPAVSNKWNYYTPGEFAAMDWSRHSYPDGPTWTAFDDRLENAIDICCAWQAEGAQMDSFQPDPGTRNFLISDVIRARAQRWNVSLPVEGDGLRIYDNGAAELYHLRPRTPFQK